ncbi:hypothetical protein [Rhodococcus aetherivorans]|uniref:hypothetical protein n=1 Tax=Rhodococcus aetherivorans TaxID=191292 RepID=UPI001E49158D|nr:hypothetical protein [Rhodococcus aetherivorans]UGQ41222.1 hypothetical protein LRQ66_24430 [Rhodococcus aetherivorans]
MGAFERCRGNDMPVAISVLASCGDIDSVRTGSGVVVGRIELCQDTGPTAAGCSIRGGRMR